MEIIRIIPHARTLRKARIQVQQMVTIGLSTKQIRRYLHQFLLWWAKTIEAWTYEELITWFIEACWDIYPIAHASALLQRFLIELDKPMCWCGILLHKVCPCSRCCLT
jgi:hypothetical protein